MSRRTLAFSSVLLLASLLPCAGLAQDPVAGSLRVTKETASAVRLAWTSAGATDYCVTRDATPTRATIIAQATGLFHVDDPPGAPGTPALWYYDVSASPPGGCFGGGACAPVTTLSCGAGYAGDTSVGCASTTADWTGCGLAGLSGPECAHAFTAPSSGDWTVTLSGMSVDLDVVVIAGASSCDPAACVASGNMSATFPALAGESFTILVDGRAGASGAYTLTVSCPPPPPDTCAPAGTLACGDRRVSDTSAAGSTDAVSGYAGCSATGLDGRELVYSFTPGADDSVSIGLLQGAAALDLVVLRDDGAGCDPAGTCLAFEDREATLNVTAGTTYYVIVDGPTGAAGAHELGLSCASAQCMSLGPIICGALRQDDNSNSGVSAMDAYPCTGLDESGPEYIYEFIAAQDGDMTATLTGLTAELDIIVMEDVLGCQADSCIAFGDSTTTFPIARGTRYFVAIEGRNGASGNYTVTFTCNVPPQDCVPASNLDCGMAGFSNNGAIGSTDAIDAYPACIDWDESGSEYVYQWIAPGDVSTLVSLSDLTADLDVFILEETGQGCSVADCIAYGDDAASFDAVAGKLYFFVVDGRAGAQGDFRIYVDCFPAPGSCRSLQALACGASVNGNNAQPGSTDSVDQWTGCTPFMEDGPEVAYEFVATADGMIDATMTGMTAELDLFVLRDDGAGCTSATCFVAGDSAVSFAATSGQRYFVVVDGRNGAVGDYSLALACR